MMSDRNRRAALRLVPSASLMLLPALALAAPAAHVEFAIGNVSATSPSGQTRALAKGADVDSGDTVNTHEGRVQLRFSDDAYMSLQPQTLFRIDDYRYDGKSDGSERGFFSLLKGGLRTITGLVGRTNKRNYRVSTTVATIGIRGTEYTLAYTNSVAGSVGEGEIEVCNGGGCLPVGSGQSFYVASDQVKPQISSKKTDLPPSQPQGSTPSFISGDQTSQSGAPDLFVLTGTQTISHATTAASLVEDRVTGVFDSNGIATQLGSIAFPNGLDESGHTGFISWGRGIGQPLSGLSSYSHYITGLPTLLPDLDKLAATNTVATYQLQLGAGTTPTADLFGGAPFAFGKLTGGFLRADFGQGLVDASVSLTIANPVTAPTSSSLSLISATGGTTSTATGNVVFQNIDITVKSLMAMNGSNATPFIKSTFPAIQSVPNGSCTASIGACTFVGMSGFFAGPNARQAGVAYQVTAQQVLPDFCKVSPCDVSGGNVKGTAVFFKP